MRTDKIPRKILELWTVDLYTFIPLSRRCIVAVLKLWDYEALVSSFASAALVLVGKDVFEVCMGCRHICAKYSHSLVL